MKNINKYLPKHTRYFKYGGEGGCASGVLELILFNNFISNLGQIYCIIKFVDETTWRGVTDTLASRAAILRDLRLKEERSLSKFCKDECKNLHLRKNHSASQYLPAGDGLAGQQLCRKTWEL